ncbi:tRNA N(3)-cytidine methyltransferase METTL8, mitochondrial [Amia ocellicauda]|uniref:tRNA N(3)-cytidine methyltransferase METTL8, mitochondrial n=1 Tax=Amia ocellicauda TaxID=2972642 RepID=UPI003464CAA2
MRRQWALSLASLAKRSLQCRLSSSRPPAPLGGRILTSPNEVFQHNMWDHVQWSEEDEENARQKAEENSSVRIPLDEQVKYDRDACKYWDGFYETHQNKFFKDRNWLFREFPEILSGRSSNGAGKEGCCHSAAASSARSYVSDSTAPLTGHSEWLSTPGCRHTERSKEGGVESHSLCGEPGREQESGGWTDTFPGSQAAFRILEVGCGAGNSVFPIVNSIKDTGTFLYCCDFSPRAVELVKAHPSYSSVLCYAFVHDVCDEAATFPFPHMSIDIILVVFVLSSIHPERMQGVVNRLTRLLKPGGILLFRDYGRYDMSQLRFKRGRCLFENFYARGDGTCVYFFTKAEVHSLFESAGLKEIQNLEDRRLQVNRRKGVVMHRVWMQSKYQKPLEMDICKDDFP